MSTLIFSFNAIAPIILVILSGCFVKHIGLLSDNFFKDANKFVFNVALPVYLFYSVYNIKDFDDINWSLVIMAVGVVLFIFFVSFIFFVLYTKDTGKRGALIQCAFRSNFAIIGIPLAGAVGGDDAVAAAAIISSVGIPTFNILAVITLSIFSYDNAQNKISVKDILISIYKNPLIRGVLSAVVLLVLRKFTDFRIKDDLPFIYDAIADIGKIASPLALIVLGGQFEISATKSLAKDISLGVLWRLVITPLVGLGTAYILANMGWVDVNSGAYPALIAFFGSPVAVSSAIMAESMHAHGELSRQLVMWSNCCSIITIFVTIVICRTFGLF